MTLRRGRAHLDRVYADDVMDILDVDHYHTGFFDPGEARVDLRRATVRYLEELVADVPIGERSLVVDVGCGPGSTARWLAARRGAWVLGVDLVGQQLRFAERGRRRALGPAVFAQMDAVSLAIRSGSVDAVVAVESLCHVEDKPAALQEMRRVLRDGGVAVISDFVLSPHARFVARRTVQAVVESDCLASESDYRRWLTEAGFAVRSLRNVAAPAAVATADALLAPENRTRLNRYLHRYMGRVAGRVAGLALPMLRRQWVRAFAGGAAGLLFVHAEKIGADAGDAGVLAQVGRTAERPSTT